MIIHRTAEVEYSIGMGEPKLYDKLNQALAYWRNQGYECVGIEKVHEYKWLLLLRDLDSTA